MEPHVRHASVARNDDDWLEMEDSPTGAGLASIWGGGDNDDALWIVPFTDHDGDKKVLALKNHQLGEYAVLRPTADSPDLVLETIESPIVYPELDSRDLPASRSSVRIALIFGQKSNLKLSLNQPAVSEKEKSIVLT